MKSFDLNNSEVRKFSILKNFNSKNRQINE